MTDEASQNRGRRRLLLAGRLVLVAVLVIAVGQAVRGWSALFAPVQPIAAERDPDDQWEHLATTLAAPGAWRFLAGGWVLDYEPGPAREASLPPELPVIPALLPEVSEEERAGVQLLAQLAAPHAVAPELWQRTIPLGSGVLQAWTTRRAKIERLVRLRLEMASPTGGICFRVDPAPQEAPAATGGGAAREAAAHLTALLPMAEPSLRLASRLDESQRVLCEIWLTRQTPDACRADWERAGWKVQELQSDPSAAGWIVRRGSEVRCVLAPLHDAGAAGERAVVVMRIEATGPNRGT